MFRVYSNPIIPYGEEPHIFLSFHSDVNSGLVRASKLDRVAQQILKQLPQLRPVNDDDRQFVVRDGDILFGDGEPQVVQDLLQHGSQHLWT